MRLRSWPSARWCAFFARVWRATTSPEQGPMASRPRPLPADPLLVRIESVQTARVCRNCVKVLDPTREWGGPRHQCRRGARGRRRLNA